MEDSFADNEDMGYIIVTTLVLLCGGDRLNCLSQFMSLKSNSFPVLHYWREIF